MAQVRRWFLVIQTQGWGERRESVHQPQDPRGAIILTLRFLVFFDSNPILFPTETHENNQTCVFSEKELGWLWYYEFKLSTLKELLTFHLAFPLSIDQT